MLELRRETAGSGKSENALTGRLQHLSVRDSPPPPSTFGYRQLVNLQKSAAGTGLHISDSWPRPGLCGSSETSGSELGSRTGGEKTFDAFVREVRRRLPLFTGEDNQHFSGQNYDQLVSTQTTF